MICISNPRSEKKATIAWSEHPHPMGLVVNTKPRSLTFDIAQARRSRWTHRKSANSKTVSISSSRFHYHMCPWQRPSVMHRILSRSDPLRVPLPVRDFLVTMSTVASSPRRSFAPIGLTKSDKAKSACSMRLQGIIFDMDGTLCMSLHGLPWVSVR